ncbi:hypothetical protein IJD34_03150 [bacterium]|nr:hypothetical protein [bacterium]
MKAISIITHQVEPNAVKKLLVSNYGIRNAARNCYSHPNYAINSNSSVIGGLFTDARHLLFTTNASTNPEFTLRTELENQLNYLRRTCQTEDVKGILVGGLRFDEKDKESQCSYYFYSKLAEAMDDLQIPFAMLCGRAKEIQPEHVYARFNHVKISSDGFKDIKTSSQQVYDVVENRYDDIFFDDGIKLDIKEHF